MDIIQTTGLLALVLYILVKDVLVYLLKKGRTNGLSAHERLILKAFLATDTYIREELEFIKIKLSNIEKRLEVVEHGRY